MSEARRELFVVAAVVALAGVGLATESLSDPVTAPAEGTAPVRHVERATFCPPAVDEDGSTMRIAVATAPGTSAPIDYQDAASEDDVTLPPPKPSAVDARSFLLHNGRDAAISAIGYGARPVGGALQEWESPVEGAGAALCSTRPSESWYFPVGSSELGYDERILLYNPFPDEAVARITLYGPTGATSKAGLNDVAVPSGSYTEVELNQFLRTQKLVSAQVDAVRGRLVAWRVLFSKPENGPRGVTFSLGAPATADTWFFPHGLLGDQSEQTLTIMNPTDQEVNAAVTIFSADVGLGEADLTDIRLEPQTSRTVSLAGTTIKPSVDIAHLSTVVQAETGAEIVVERSLSVDEGDLLEGVSNEVGASTSGTRWLVPPLGTDVADDSIAILNATRGPARVDITLYTRTGAKSPPALTGLNVESARRLERSLEDYAEDEPFYAVVTSDRPVFVERLGYSTTADDLVDVMGRSVVPLPEDEEEPVPPEEDEGEDETDAEDEGDGQGNGGNGGGDGGNRGNGGNNGGGNGGGDGGNGGNNRGGGGNNRGNGGNNGGGGNGGGGG